MFESLWSSIYLKQVHVYMCPYLCPYLYIYFYLYFSLYVYLYLYIYLSIYLYFIGSISLENLGCYLFQCQDCLPRRRDEPGVRRSSSLFSEGSLLVTLGSTSRLPNSWSGLGQVSREQSKILKDSKEKGKDCPSFMSPGMLTVYFVENKRLQGHTKCK